MSSKRQDRPQACRAIRPMASPREASWRALRRGPGRPVAWRLVAWRLAAWLQVAKPPVAWRPVAWLQVAEPQGARPLVPCCPSSQVLVPMTGTETAEEGPADDEPALRDTLKSADDGAQPIGTPGESTGDGDGAYAEHSNPQEGAEARTIAPQG